MWPQQPYTSNPVSLTPIYQPPQPPPPLYPVVDPSQHPELIASAPMMEEDPMDVSGSPTATASYSYYPLHTQHPDVKSSYVPPLYFPPPRLETDFSRVDRAAQMPLKFIGGLAFGGISIFLGSATFIAGSTTSLLLAVGNPGCLLTGAITFIFAVATLRCAKTALEIFKEIGRDCNEMMP